jgi:hypothetical protein
VLGPNLEIFKIYVGFWFFGRPSIYDLWSDIRELRMKFDYNFDPLTQHARTHWAELHPDRAEDALPAALMPKRKKEKATAGAR